MLAPLVEACLDSGQGIVALGKDVTGHILYGEVPTSCPSCVSGVVLECAKQLGNIQ